MINYKKDALSVRDLIKPSALFVRERERGRQGSAASDIIGQGSSSKEHSHLQFLAFTLCGFFHFCCWNCKLLVEFAVRGRQEVVVMWRRQVVLYSD
jgi:hypothetical protein